MRNIFFIIIFQLTLGACAQTFLWDGTFQPFFNIRNQPSVYVGDIHELNSGKLIVISEPNKEYQISIKVNGYQDFVTRSVLKNDSHLTFTMRKEVIE